MEAQQQIIEDEINLLDFFIVILKRKRLVLGGSLCFAILAMMICLIMSPIFEATTKLMPPQQQGSTAGSQFVGQFGGVASMVLGGFANTVTGDLYIGLMMTPAVLDPIISRFGLMKQYDLDTIDQARKKVTDDVFRGEMDLKSGIVSIIVQDTSAQKAADIANAFAEELKKLLDRIAFTDAGKKRLFLEQQLKKAHDNLQDAENALKGFQEGTGAIKIDDQAAAVLQGIASVRAMIASKEVQLQVMRTYAAPHNPDLKRAEEELLALREQLKKLEEKQGNETPSVIIPTDQIPNLGIEYLRKLRDFKYGETLFELITKQYEAARLDEAREAGVVQVIYPATPPQRRAKPNTLIIVAVMFVAGLFLLTLSAFVLEAMERASKRPGNEDRMYNIKGMLKGL